jgi:phosphate transport system substrate-binding protein
MRLAVALAIWCLAVAGCNRQSGSKIRIDGSSTVYPITEAVVEEYRSVAPEVRVTAAYSGTTAGFSQFAAGEIDMWGASRPIQPEEEEQLEQAGIGFIELAVAYDGLAVVVNPQNDWVESLTMEQLRNIWKPDGRAESWSDLNPQWPDEPIKLYGPGTASGTFEYFTEEVVGKKGASTNDYTPNENDNVLVTGVAEDKYALAYFGLAYYLENADRLKLVGIDGGEGPVKPSVETVSGGTYPLSRPLFLYVRTRSLSDPAGAAFTKFYLENAAELAKEVGYVPVPEEADERNWERFRGAAPDGKPAEAPSEAA